MKAGVTTRFVCRGGEKRRERREKMGKRRRERRSLTGPSITEIN